MKSTTSCPIQLSLAPSEFVPQLWQDFCALFATEQAALENLGSVPLKWSATMAQVDIKRRFSESDEDAQAVQRGTISDQIEETVRSALLSGRLVATGLQPPSMTRVEIAGCLWADLKFAFQKNSAANSGFAFTHVEIIPGVGDPASRTAACQAWLKEQPRQPKKTLKAGAMARVPGLTTREYSAAFTAAFATKLGRPGNPEEI
jgi:hypothetical protein